MLTTGIMITLILLLSDGVNTQRMFFISRTNVKIKNHSNFLRAHKNLINTNDVKK